jgi:hypothetical protein
MAQQAVVRTRPPTPARARKTAPPTSAAAAKRTATQEASRVTATASGQARRVKSTAVGQGKVVARTASQDARELAGAVRTQAEQVTGELADQARDLLAETRSQLQEQADAQTTRMARALYQVGSQAVALSEGRPDQAGPLAEYAEQAAGWLDTCAAQIEERGLEGLASDVVDFARRRPGVFLAGAALLGVGVGRLIRSGAVSSTDGASDVPGLEA